MRDLTNDEHAQAAREGWCLSEGQYGTIIERDDDRAVFRIDDEAILHVERQAHLNRSPMHIKALAIHHASWAAWWAEQAELRAYGYTAEELQAEEAIPTLTQRAKQRLWACDDCGCTDVQEIAWIEMNTGEVQGDEAPMDMHFCPQCGHSEIGVEQTAEEPKPCDEQQPQPAA